MSPGTKTERWKLIQDIFQRALELPAGERYEYVSRACGGDRELEVEVGSLLANDSTGTATLRFGLASDLKRLAREASFTESGLRVGPYRLISELDGGGMGVVYLAVRSDDHYFQIVAIKMIRRGMDSPVLAQRLRAERQVLATLTHPNIGAILDGGDTEDGRPYMVMEYVEGQPITEASETRGLSIGQRVDVFQSVYAAVHYAHQKLVIHRDIKPGNVLVTSDGLVNLIDFGISKPLVPELIPGGPAPTEAWQKLMTPDYASPEQVLGKSLTLATDIYSLGVLLFELLTGARPYSLRDLTPAAAEKVVLEQEPRRPSSVKELSKGARAELSGDLDRIVLMAMEKDPSRRYLSAEEFSQDLQRFLEGKPVRARRATPIYRLRKFAGRHKTGSFLACANATVMVGSGLFYAWQSRLTDQKVAQMENIADAATSDLTEKLQQSSLPVEVQASLFRTAFQSLVRLRESSGNDPRVLLSLSKAFARIGDLEGSPFVGNLGDQASTVTSYQESLRAAREANSRLGHEESAKAVSEAYLRLCNLESFLGRAQQAESDCRQTVAWSRQVWQQKPEDPDRRALMARSYSGLGNMQLDELQPDQAVATLRSGLRVFGSDLNGTQDHDRVVFFLYRNLAVALSEFGSLEEAISVFRKSMAAAERLAHDFPYSTRARRILYLSYQTIVAPLAGEKMLNVGDTKTSRFYARKSLDLAKSLAAADPNNAQAHQDLGFAYESMGDALRLTQPAAAAEYYRKAIAIAKDPHLNFRDGREADYLTAEREEELAWVLMSPKSAGERLALLREANGIRKRLVSSGRGAPLDRLCLMRSWCKLSDAELSMTDLAQASRDTNASRSYFAEFKDNSPSLVVQRELGMCYESLGNVQRRIAEDRSRPPAERRAALASSRNWYTKSSGVWDEWHSHGVDTPESEAERRKVDRMLENR
jgi:serine/threonine protein kinase